MGDAVVRVVGDLSDVEQKLGQLKGDLNNLSKDVAAPAEGLSAKLAEIGTVITKIGVAVSAVGGVIGATLIGAAKDGGKYVEHLEQLAARTGLTVQELQVLEVVAVRVGQSIDGFAQPLARLSKNFEEAIGGSEKAQAKFEALGVTISESDKPIDVLRRIADAVSQLPDGFQKSAAVAELFGRYGTALIPIFNQGSKAFDAAGAAAKAMGQIMSATAQKDLGDMDDAFDDLGLSVKALERAVGATFAPTLKAMAEAVTATLGTFNNWFSGLDEGTKKLITIFTGAFLVSGPILIAIGGFMAALAVITAPMLITGAIVAGIAAGVGLIIAYWDSLKNTGITIWNGITGFIASAKDAIVKSVQAIYQGMVEWLVTKAEAVAAKVDAVAKTIAKPFEWLADHLVGHSVVPDMVDQIGAEMNRLPDLMGAPSEQAAQRVSAAFGSIAAPAAAGNAGNSPDEAVRNLQAINDQVTTLDVRMGSAARNATASTVRAVRDMQFGWDEALSEMASVGINTWGNVSNTFSSAMAQNILHGNDWKKTMDSIYASFLTSVINTSIQMMSQFVITTLFGSEQNTAQATAHTAMESAKTAATTAGEAARLGIMAATNKAILAGVVATLAGIGAVGDAALATMQVVVTTTAGIFEAIGAALAVSIVGSPLAPEYFAAGAEVLGAGTLAVGTGTGALQTALGTAIATATGALAVPALARGGIAFGPTLAMVGEGGQPEVIAPLDRLPGLVGPNAGGSMTVLLQMDGMTIAKAVAPKMTKLITMKLGTT